MDVRRNPEREEKIEQSARLTGRSGHAAVDPRILFARAGNDDIARYTPAMLARAAEHAHHEIGAWRADRTRPRITVEPIDALAVDGAGVSVLAITSRNMPFLYDSVMAEVTSTHRDIALAVHPILLVGEDGSIDLHHVDRAGSPAERVSHIQVHLPRLGTEAGAALARRLDHVLAQVGAAVSDWRAMLETLGKAIAAIETTAFGDDADRREALAFLNWLHDDNFTFLGMREYHYTAGEARDDGTPRVERDGGSGLGILADPDMRVLRLGKDHVVTTPEILAFLEGPDFLLVTKANMRSVVHRRAYMDYIGVKRFDAEGRVAGELRIVGLFTSTAYTRSLSNIPLLRAKADTVIARFGYDPGSHSGKTLLNTLESYPRDELFQIDADLLADFCEQIQDLAERPRVRVLARPDRFDRFVSVMVYVPRDQYDSAAREAIGAYLADIYEGHVSAFYPAFPEGGVARVHFIVGRTGGKTPEIDQEALESAVRDLVTRWEERYAAIVPPDAPRLDVGDAYRDHFSPEEAVADLDRLSACDRQAPIQIDFYRCDWQQPHELSLKIFHFSEPVALSRRVPLLENLGFSVISERTYEIALHRADGSVRDVVLHDMELVHMDGAAVDLDRRKEALHEAYLSVWHGRNDNDSFNRLVVNAGLTCRQASVLRALSRYLGQGRITYTQDYIADTLNRHAAIAADLFALFSARFDPDLTQDAREQAAQALAERIETALADVPRLDDDRILRRLAGLVGATLRANYFQTGPDGAPPATLTFKLDPGAVEGLPEPRPFREIFVYGPQVEGVHLRFGPVARGGIRWSDRALDYRTEVLGLVKAQQVKNAVIVPVGAKGGFYPRALPAGGGRESVFAAGKEAYKTFISSMLALTDNLDGGRLVPPPRTVRHDGQDPYFVVAADKGTATFSDTANAISQEHGFWLDDAFASGGSAGYDHKKMGITARGAWEAVKRHFREIDVDIQSTPFTVVGVGDMSGDVFGNGMLLSRKIRLLAAFDHRDIFIDPEPDCETGFSERQRLFGMQRSSWQDYDRSRLSAGGMIVSRSQKAVTLTDEAAALLGLPAGKATPFEIMRAILACRADLLWFGGIGTYVRASGETDTQVGDRSNDPIRIDARALKVKVIGEGANLGLTQRARIEFAMAGGRCNSDAIDNSAGVNSSDVEVNIKIALAAAMREERLTRRDRDALLSKMTPEVARLVLRNNYLQTLAISLTERLGLEAGEELGALMEDLEARGALDREVALLPDAQTLAERHAAGKPLTRPEIGVLLSYAKIVLFDDLTRSRLVDDPYFEPLLFSYFPREMRGPHAADIRGHRLRREIVATLLANDAINRGRPGFLTQMTAATGAPPADVVRAFVLAREGMMLEALWASIDALDTRVAGTLQNALYGEATDALRTVTAWALKSRVFERDLADTVEAIRDATAALRPALPGLLPAFMVGQAEERRAELTQAGVPEALAAAVADLPVDVLVPEIMLIAEEAGTPLEQAAAAYFAVTETFRLGRIIAVARKVATADRYESLALKRSVSEISAARRAITVAALGRHAAEDDPVTAWIEEDRTRVERVRAQLTTLIGTGELTVAKMSVAAGQMSDLARALGGERP